MKQASFSKEHFWWLARFAFIVGVRWSAGAHIAAKPLTRSFERALLSRYWLGNSVTATRDASCFRICAALWHCAPRSTTSSSPKSIPLRLKHPLNGLNLAGHLAHRCNVFWRRAAGKLPPRLVEQHTQVEALQFTAREQERTLQLGQCSMRLLLSSRKLPLLDARLRTTLGFEREFPVQTGV